MDNLGTIELNERETEILKRINFKADYRDEGKSTDAAGELMLLLLARDAIPERRLRYFYDGGWMHRSKSMNEVFEGNGTRGADIFFHGNFLKFLRFFVHGADLSNAIKQEFQTAVGDPSWFGGEDVQDLVKVARKLVRSNGLTSQSSDDFMQLCADIELSLDHSDAIRRAVLAIR